MGWNHVGYPSFESVYMETSLTGICYDSIERFDPNSPPTYLQVADPMVDEFEPGEGYWIDMQWIPPGPCGVFWEVSNNMGNINLV